jgi:TRAP-type C4-dicarboxylate transport system permease small subunit
MTNNEKSNPFDYEERPNDVFGRFLLGVVTVLAIVGGVVLLFIVLVNFFSILGRVLFAKPLTGDFELVEMGCAIAMFSFLPLCQLKSGNVIVDFFTIKLSDKKKAFLNGVGSFIFFLVAGFFTWRMIYGAFDMYEYNEQTMLLQIPVWIPFIPAVVSFFILSVTCFYTFIRFMTFSFRGS